MKREARVADVDPMSVLGFAGALVALLLGAVLLNFAAQTLEGRDSFFLHFGWLALVVVTGAVFFPLWSWTSTAWVLGAAALWSLARPLWQRLFGEPPQGYLYHGDPPEGGES